MFRAKITLNLKEYPHVEIIVLDTDYQRVKKDGVYRAILVMSFLDMF